MAWIGPVIGLATSYLGSKSADRRAKGQAATATNLMLQQQREAMRIQGQLGGITSKYLDPAAKYWQTLLSGDRNALDTALRPEISQINDSYGQAKREAAQFAPRGGLTASMMSQLPFQQAAQVNNLYTSARPMAAQQLAGLGQVAGNLAIGGSAASSGAYQGASGTYDSLSRYLAGQYPSAGATGEAFGGYLQQFVTALTDAYQKAPTTTPITSAGGINSSPYKPPTTPPGWAGTIY